MWVIATKKILMGFLIAAISSFGAIALTSVIDNTMNAPIYVPTPPPPTMTVTLRIGEDLVRHFIMDVPTEKDPSWRSFTVDLNALKPDEKGLLKCRLFISKDKP